MLHLRQIEVNFDWFFSSKISHYKETAIDFPKEDKISPEFKAEENKDGSENPKLQKKSIENTLLNEIVDEVSISGNDNHPPHR